jgi:hypothetical protein
MTSACLYPQVHDFLIQCYEWTLYLILLCTCKIVDHENLKIFIDFCYAIPSLSKDGSLSSLISPFLSSDGENVSPSKHRDHMDDTETISKALEGAEDFLQIYCRSEFAEGDGLLAHWKNRLHISNLSVCRGADSRCHNKWLAGLCQQ